MSFETVTSTIKNSNNHVRKSPKAIFSKLFFKKNKNKKLRVEEKIAENKNNPKELSRYLGTLSKAGGI